MATKSTATPDATEEQAENIREIRAATESYLRDREDSDLEDGFKIMLFCEKIDQLVRELGDVEVHTGCGSPEGVVGDYPPLWVEFCLEGAVYEQVDCLNHEAVDVHLIENKSGEYANTGETYSYTVLTLKPSIC